MSSTPPGIQALRILLFLSTAAALSVGGLFLSFAHSPHSGGRAEPYILEVRRGTIPREITDTLAREGIVSNGKLMHWLGRITRSWASIKAGEYSVSAKQSPMEIFSTLASGISVAQPFTVREGNNQFEIAAEFARRGYGTKEEFLAATRDPSLMRMVGLVDPLPSTLEGYLFPETYSFPRRTSATEMVRLMARTCLSFWTPERQAKAQAHGFTLQQVLTLASMIEKETGFPPERPVISSVFHNRLKKRMRLQSDPTTIYGIWDRYQGNLRRQDLLTPTPYNTYTIPALPIGPIGNPGREAIDAALEPATTEYLFFVSRNDGTHEFTSTYEEHSAAVRKLQLDPRAREGKSWRDALRKDTPAAAPAAR